MLAIGLDEEDGYKGRCSKGRCEDPVVVGLVDRPLAIVHPVEQNSASTMQKRARKRKVQPELGQTDMEKCDS